MYRVSGWSATIVHPSRSRLWPQPPSMRAACPLETTRQMATSQERVSVTAHLEDTRYYGHGLSFQIHPAIAMAYFSIFDGEGIVDF